MKKAELQAELDRLQRHLGLAEASDADREELENRARELAAPHEEQVDSNLRDFLLIQSGGESFLLEIDIVFRVAARAHTCRIPRSEAAFQGLVALNGELLPFVTLGESESDAQTTVEDEFFIVVGMGQAEFAIWAETEPQRVQLQTDDIAALPERADGAYVTRVSATGVGVVDSERLLSNPKLWTTRVKDISTGHMRREK